MLDELLDNHLGKILGGFCAVLIVAVVWVIILASQQEGRWRAWCADNGGRVDGHTSVGVGTGVGTNGQVTTVTTTSTTLYCLTDDGRILDIY